MHSDDIPAGVSIGQHNHDCNEEVYYLLRGAGVLTFDGVNYRMNAGDVSPCTPGHSHGFEATADSCLIDVGSGLYNQKAMQAEVNFDERRHF